MVTPYITPAMLLNVPTGVSWSLIPAPKATSAAQAAELTNVCWRATSIVDTFCHQVLRATADTEYLTGPGHPRCNIDSATCLGVLQMKRWPVTSVLAMQTCPNRTMPRVWSPVPAGSWDIRHPLIYSGDSASATAPDGGWTIDVTDGVITWDLGRRGWRVMVCYENGWPHAALTAAAAAGATVLTVDDVTGWAGASGFIYDGGATETVSVTSVTATAPLVLPGGAGTAQAGPGTITLSSPVTWPHQPGTMVSALPANVIEAAALACAAQAIGAGIDALAIQTTSGAHVSSASPTEELATEYELLLSDFRRIA